VPIEDHIERSLRRRAEYDAARADRLGVLHGVFSPAASAARSVASVSQYNLEDYLRNRDE
jgi:hypothetical protein